MKSGPRDLIRWKAILYWGCQMQMNCAGLAGPWNAHLIYSALPKYHHTRPPKILASSPSTYSLSALLWGFLTWSLLSKTHRSLELTLTALWRHLCWHNCPYFWTKSTCRIWGSKASICFALTYVTVFWKLICVGKVSDSAIETVDKRRECFLLLLQ